MGWLACTRTHTLETPPPSLPLPRHTHTAQVHANASETSHTHIQHSTAQHSTHTLLHIHGVIPCQVIVIIVTVFFLSPPARFLIMIYVFDLFLILHTRAYSSRPSQSALPWLGLAWLGLGLRASKQKKSLKKNYIVGRKRNREREEMRKISPACGVYTAWLRQETAATASGCGGGGGGGGGLYVCMCVRVCVQVM